MENNRRHELNGLLVDHTRQRITDANRAALAAVLPPATLATAIAGLFNGETVNPTEKRPALHPALRGNRGDYFPINGLDVMDNVLAVRQQMREISDSIRRGVMLGITGHPIRTIIHIGIGGSDLGPRLALQALAPDSHPGLTVRLVANLDASDLHDALHGADPATTLIVVASKTFTTAETLQNARSALHWLTRSLTLPNDAILGTHFLAITANPSEAERFGIAPRHILRFWDWVGGRYSLWSAIGLPVAIAIGMDQFEDMLAGARAMDHHFRHAPPDRNIPVQMALAGLHNITHRNATSLSVVPYCHRLRLLPAYLQQLEMESNGKRIDIHGQPVAGMTAPVIFGDAGTNAQHAYFQMLHQGTHLIPTDFIAIAEDDSTFAGHHEQLLANCLAQAAALETGCTDPDNPHKSCRGGQPSTTIILPRLTPYYFGMLLALYEHKVYVQATAWGINPFDQWGVELGKTLARNILPALQGTTPSKTLDHATTSLIAHIHKYRQPTLNRRELAVSASPTPPQNSHINSNWFQLHAG